MSKTVKMYRHGKGGLTPTRVEWEGDYPPDQNGFKQRGYERAATLGDDYGMNYDVYRHETGKWLILIWMFQEFITTIKITDQIEYIQTLTSLSESALSIAKAKELAEVD